MHTIKKLELRRLETKFKKMERDYRANVSKNIPGLPTNKKNE